jgi:hypothetical protein
VIRQIHHGRTYNLNRSSPAAFIQIHLSVAVAIVSMERSQQTISKQAQAIFWRDVELDRETERECFRTEQKNILCSRIDFEGEVI